VQNYVGRVNNEFMTKVHLKKCAS